MKQPNNDKPAVKDYLTTEEKARAEAKRYADLPKHQKRQINRRLLFESYRDGYIDGFNQAKQLLND